MNYKQANAVKHLATPVNKVLEGLRVDKCWHCDGSGYFMARPDEDCNGTGKVPYSWTPQVGEWCIRYKKASLIIDVDECGKKIWLDNYSQGRKPQESNEFIPILEWEVIEEILQKAGYNIVVNYYSHLGSDSEYYCTIWKDEWKDEEEIDGEAKSRQGAVMKAVIELGEELK